MLLPKSYLDTENYIKSLLKNIISSSMIEGVNMSLKEIQNYSDIFKDRPVDFDTDAYLHGLDVFESESRKSEIMVGGVADKKLSNKLLNDVDELVEGSFLGMFPDEHWWLGK